MADIKLNEPFMLKRIADDNGGMGIYLPDNYRFHEEDGKPYALASDDVLKLPSGDVKLQVEGQEITLAMSPKTFAGVEFKEGKITAKFSTEERQSAGLIFAADAGGFGNVTGPRVTIQYNDAASLTPPLNLRHDTVSYEVRSIMTAIKTAIQNEDKARLIELGFREEEVEKITKQTEVIIPEALHKEQNVAPQKPAETSKTVPRLREQKSLLDKINDALHGTYIKSRLKTFGITSPPEAEPEDKWKRAQSEEEARAIRERFSQPQPADAERPANVTGKASDDEYKKAFQQGSLTGLSGADLLVNSKIDKGNIKPKRNLNLLGFEVYDVKIDMDLLLWNSQNSNNTDPYLQAESESARQRVNERLDANGDNQISPEELRGAIDALKKSGINYTIKDEGAFIETLNKPMPHAQDAPKNTRNAR